MKKFNNIFISANQNAAIIADPTSTASQIASAQVLFDGLAIDLKNQAVIVLRGFIMSFWLQAIYLGYMIQDFLKIKFTQLRNKKYMISQNISFIVNSISTGII